ncbi:MAG: S41 family peptidase [Lysobacteraceae bacterium]
MRALVNVAVLAFLFVGETGSVQAGQGGAAAVELSAEQSAQDVRILKRALLDMHPALTKYLSQSDFDATLKRFEGRGNAARSVGEMYLAATEMAASIRCGHTWTNVLNQEGSAKRVLLESADKLPFTLMLVANRWLVLASADAAVNAGDEVLAINGIEAPDIVTAMMPYLRADGSSDGKRLRQLNHNRSDFSQMDIIWPLLAPPEGGRYALSVRRPSGQRDQITVAATTLARRAAALADKGITSEGESWQFRIEGNTAFMTLPTFSFWNSDFDWAAFIDRAFTELNSRNIPHLVIDIRLNEGGDGAIGGKILEHLIRSPLQFLSDQSTSAYERAPYITAKYMDTWDYSFFDRTGQVERIREGTAAGKYRFLPKANGIQTIEPTAQPYNGKTFILIGAENSSATFQFAKLVKDSGSATLIGQATGGNLRGLNGGQLAWVVLPNSGVAVDIPLLAATYTEATPDASIVPDVMVSPSFEATAAGRDLEMEAVFRLIDSTPDAPRESGLPCCAQ